MHNELTFGVAENAQVQTAAYRDPISIRDECSHGKHAWLFGI